LIQKESDNEIIKNAIDFEDKIEMLFKQFFSSTEQIDLSNTLRYQYSNVIAKTHEKIIENEISQTIKKCKSDDVSKSDDISNKILKLLINKFMSTLLRFFAFVHSKNITFVAFERHTSSH
jgi:hypothetical protein